MTIITIHILEALVVFLIGLKLIRIKNLYTNSLVHAHAHPQPIASSKPKKRKATNHKLDSLNTKNSTNLFLKTLPEPEVLYASDHEELVLTETPEVKEEEKSILNSYIDDFFYETPEFSFDESPVAARSTFSDTQRDDEFITVQEENAEMVRALEALKREIGLSARV